MKLYTSDIFEPGLFLVPPSEEGPFICHDCPVNDGCDTPCYECVSDGDYIPNKKEEEK